MVSIVNFCNEHFQLNLSCLCLHIIFFYCGKIEWEFYSNEKYLDSKVLFF